MSLFPAVAVRQSKSMLWTFVVALLALAIVLVTIACGAESGTVPETSLASLVAAPAQWQGKKVEFRGTLREFEDADGETYGVIEDAAHNRIGLKAISEWQSLVGQEVVATGRMEFDDSFGWYLARPLVTSVDSPALRRSFAAAVAEDPDH